MRLIRIALMISPGKGGCSPLNGTGTDMSRVIAFVACGLTLGGCASSNLDFLKPTPSTITMQFESKPAGAEARTSTGESCRTPCALAMAPDKEFSVTFALSGYQPQTVPVQMGQQDDLPASDAEQKLLPNPVFAELKPAKPPAKRAPAPAKKPASAKPAAAGEAPWPPVR